MASTIKNLKKGVWSSYTPTKNLTQITHTRGKTPVIYTESINQPKDPIPVSNFSELKDIVYFHDVTTGERIWMVAMNADAQITITTSGS